ncbi:MAG: LemA family protein [Bacilli bacterium]
MKIALIILAVVVLLVLLFIGTTYNKLVNFKNRVKDQWAQIDVLLKRRTDLIPNLVETVKGYAKHESETLENVIAARNKVVGAKSIDEEIKADGELSKALGRLMAISEAYPDLKANTNFMNLQENLKDTEDKIQYARQFYNDSVLNYKNHLEMFPSNIVAKMFNFKPEAFFEADEASKEVPKVQF